MEYHHNRTYSQSVVSLDSSGRTQCDGNEDYNGNLRDEMILNYRTWFAQSVNSCAELRVGGRCKYEGNMCRS